MSVPTTRLAPSPTGALHLGNARTFLVNWTLARQRDWRIVYRVEDLDTPRVKPGAIEETGGILRWLGLDWDEEAQLQTADLEPYDEAMRTLAAKRLVYPCELSRKEIAEAAGAPHDDTHESRFPPELRPAEMPESFDDRHTNWRFVTNVGSVEYDDGFAGSQRHVPADTVGDFVVWTKRGVPAYQLAVVADDHRQGVTHVVRGDDLLDSAARQLLLYRALGYQPEPAQMHLPLVRGPDGRRLAKRHGDTRLTHYRDLGVPAERIVALLGRWCGLEDAGSQLSAAGFAERFSLDTMPAEDVVFTQEDDRWLLDGASR